METLKNKKRVFILILILLQFGITSCDIKKTNQSSFSKESGLNIELKNNIFLSIEEDSEGKEIELNVYNYEILKNNNPFYKQNYPKHTYHNKKGKSITWKNTSFSKNDNNLEILYSYNYIYDDTKKEVQKMIKAIEQKNNIYSYSFLEVNDKISEYLLFVVDSVNSRYYIYELYNQ